MSANTDRKPMSTRSLRTRHSLVEAGLQLFSERPVDAVPIDDIVATAGVSKGSFFNHFEDKQKFADSISADIRMDLEARITNVNEGVSDPLTRIIGGMRVAADFALREKQRTIIMTRGSSLPTGRDHPLNAGLRSDMEAASEAGLLREEARSAGILFWLGACHWVMANIVDKSLSRAEAAIRLRNMMVMSLIGLGVDEVQAQQLAADSETWLLTNTVAKT